ncbi:MAG: phosphoglycerate kinase [Candidatus Omnitrophota bacterium]|jgi:phosphoglycerate kinase|nr:MAG: phosphoglycerate kinase [Candidatus Omnitrophota bacterium]
MNKMSIKDIDLNGKVVLMRADFNVPLDSDLKITDDTRIKATLETINYIIANKAKKLILMSHLGRPDGKVIAKYSLKPVSLRLKELLGQNVLMLDDCVGPEVESKIKSSNEKVILLENLRFHEEEEGNDPEFAKKLASSADLFVNDAFGTAHRAHASTEGVTHYLKSVAGFLIEKEIKYLGAAVANPAKPFAVILGGAKVSDKIGVIDNLLPKCDIILIGGGMSYTFLKAKGIQIGNSKLEKDKIDIAKAILEKAKEANKKILLPVDHIVVAKIDETSKPEVVGESIPEGMIAVDIGPKTVELFNSQLKSSKTIVWNGPLGIFEMEPFSKGTKNVAEFIAGLDTVSIIGGGDTAAAIAKFNLEDKMSHISTGGGASLEYLEGKTLPGIAALADK